MARADLQDRSDEQLLQLYVSGELAAMEVLLQRYKTPLYNFILRMVRDPARAEDFLQETFLRLVEHASSFEGNAKLRTWLYRIARNLCIDHARKQVHRRHPSLDAPQAGAESSSSSSLHDRVADVQRGVDRQTAGKQLGERIAVAVESLPPDQREVFLMRQVQGLAFKEIADAAGVSENTAKSRMRYALERLQNALNEYRDYSQELR